MSFLDVKDEKSDSRQRVCYSDENCRTAKYDKSGNEASDWERTTNMAGTGRPHTTWKWKHMFRKMVILGSCIGRIA